MGNEVTFQWLPLTFDGSGVSGNRPAATKKMSGAGFPFLTSGSDDPITLW